MYSSKSFLFPSRNRKISNNTSKSTNSALWFSNSLIKAKLLEKMIDELHKDDEQQEDDFDVDAALPIIRLSGGSGVRTS